MSEPDAKTYATRDGPMMGLRGDFYISRALETYGEFSGLERDLLEQVVKPGMTVVEIGANIGAHSIGLARKCAPGTLYLFEPQQRIFQLLCANLAMNDIRNAVAYPEASGDSAGFVTLPPVNYSVEGNFGGVSMQPDAPEAPGRRVRVTPLDSLNLAACHLLKIDVEGFEPQVLRGAAETIRRCRPILYVEADRAAHQGEIIGLIDELGYTQYWHTPPMFNPNNFNGVQENIYPTVVSLNLFCLPKERTDKVAGAVPIDPHNWRSPVPCRP